jgi:hypothetical protein
MSTESKSISELTELLTPSDNDVIPIVDLATGVTKKIKKVNLGAGVGSTGPTGPQGTTGFTGATGTAGGIGVTGATGPIGLTGETGPQGLVGATGTQGIQGYTGPTGAQGDVGMTGSTGPVGTQGATGTMGATGAVGATGSTGEIGATGVQGIQGLQGNTGSTGPQGDIGATGVIGITGATGPQGDVGGVGSTGATGSTGGVGSTGATGAIGTTGPTGPFNENGFRFIYSTDIANTDPTSGKFKFDSATLSLITSLRISETDADSSDVSSWITKFNDSTSINKSTLTIRKIGTPTTFLIIQVTGTLTDSGTWDSTNINFVSTGGIFSDGDSCYITMSRTGDMGTTGPTGGVGATGSTGSQGDVGAVGATGATGTTGGLGATGVAGGLGATGATGVSGLEGSTGATGTQGVQGTTGATGPAGDIGATGAIGITGATGPQGTTGPTGPNALGGGTLTGILTLGENTSIALDPAGSADGKYSGITVTGVAGYAQTYGDLVYLASADSRWELADSDAATTSDRMLAMVVVAGAADGNACTLLLQGIIRADAKFPALTIGSAVYVGETAGAIQVAIPTGADNVIRRVGYALTADEIYFNPSMDSQITVA